jgi:3-phosphoshikimate 1-carboxyvinyltransferase
VNREKSSQFVSGILLNAWNLDFPLKIEWDQTGVSEGYWQMSTQVVKDFGMRLENLEKGVLIPAHSKAQIQTYQIESDLSSSFAIAAYAALNGEATFRSFPFQSLQPDKVFVQILEKMGAGVETGADYVRIFQKTPGLVSLQGVHWNLNECPDLFPVLATLCAFAKDSSRLDGAPHLVFKESNRIQKTAELLGHLGVQTKILPDGMEVHPPARLVMPTSSFSYDTDHDHRLAFAAALVASQTSSIQILHPEVVQKSFPEFWQIIDQQKVAA